VTYLFSLEQNHFKYELTMVSVGGSAIHSRSEKLW